VRDRCTQNPPTNPASNGKRERRLKGQKEKKKTNTQEPIQFKSISHWIEKRGKSKTKGQKSKETTARKKREKEP